MTPIINIPGVDGRRADARRMWKFVKKPSGPGLRELMRHQNKDLIKNHVAYTKQNLFFKIWTKNMNNDYQDGISSEATLLDCTGDLLVDCYQRQQPNVFINSY